MLELISQLSAQIKRYDAQVRTLIRTQYPVAQRLQQPVGVGPCGFRPSCPVIPREADHAFRRR